MKAPNHIAGGILVTGLFASLFDFNIFSDLKYILATIFFSLLPDIDTPKSILGFIFYPISKKITTVYGHRTITHSLTLFLPLYLIFYLYFHEYSIIFFWSYFSHLLLDMASYQGIPLFYPFFKNSCVFPGNSEYRLKNSNTIGQSVVFVFFCVSIFFFSDLFEKGFWTTYNQQFNDTSHLYREFKRSNKILSVQYKFSVYDKNYNGNGYVVYSDENACSILTENSFMHINTNRQGLVLEYLQIEPKNKIVQLLDTTFFGLSITQINKLFEKMYITKAEIFASQKIDIITKNGLSSSSYFKLKQEYEPKFFFDDLLKSKKTQNKAKIKRIKTKIAREKKELKKHSENHRKNKETKAILIDSLKKTEDLYKLNEIRGKIKFLTEKIEKYKPLNREKLEVLYENLELEEEKPKTQTEPKLKGKIEYFKYNKL